MGDGLHSLRAGENKQEADSCSCEKHWGDRGGLADFMTKWRLLPECHTQEAGSSGSVMCCITLSLKVAQADFLLHMDIGTFRRDAHYAAEFRGAWLATPPLHHQPCSSTIVLATPVSSMQLKQQIARAAVQFSR